VHDRRIDGVPHTFGNFGALFMNAMTWWDHETRSVWSQPWGRAVAGEYRGVELFLLPSKVTTWADWKATHPETLAMVNDLDRLFGPSRQGFSPNYVLGLLLGDNARAYYYKDVAPEGLLNDSFAGLPIVIWADETSMQAYFRRVEEKTLTFQLDEGQVTDSETGSSWDLARGIASGGPLRGTALQPVPSSSSYDWAWRDFYPQSEFYAP
jgi:hypothetical protein